MAASEAIQNTITVGNALGWSIALLNGALLLVISLIIYIYTQDKNKNDKENELLHSEIANVEGSLLTKVATVESKMLSNEQHNDIERKKLYAEIRVLEKNTRSELKEGMDGLEKHLTTRIIDAMTRIEEKIDTISQDTKKIGELEHRVATAVNDIDWLKKNSPNH